MGKSAAMPGEGSRGVEAGPAEVVDDLAQHFDALVLQQRDVEVAALAAAEYAEVELIGRWHGALGADVVVQTVDGQYVAGTVEDVGSDHVRLCAATATWLVRTAAIASVTGLPDRARDPRTRPISARLSIGSALRTIGEDHRACSLRLVSGEQLHGRPDRVGRDFVELRAGRRRRLVVVPLAAVVAVVCER